MEYHMTETVPEILGILGQADGRAMILAGGTDLMIDLEEGRKAASVLVDITRTKELHGIRQEDGELVIGGAATLTEVSRSPLVRQYFPSLARGAGVVGSLQIRNLGTLAGNVITAQPAADGAMSLAPLAPVFVIESCTGTRRAGMEEMYAGFGKSSLDSSRELVTQIRIPLPGETEAASFIRLELRRSLALPMLNAAAMVKVDQGIVQWARITMGPVGVGPKRAYEAEKWLAGREFNSGNRKEAAGKVLLDASPRSNPLRGSREYRMEVLPVLIERALEDIAQQLSLKAERRSGLWQNC